MSADMTPEKAVEAIRNMGTEDTLAELDKEIDSAVENCKQQLTAIQGRIHGLQTAKRMISAVTRMRNGTPTQEPMAPTPPTPSDNKLDKERIARLTAGKCTFKPRRGKWCARNLRTKAEKKCGYCKTHMAELGITSKKGD